MKKVAILQSNYIPWKGYFNLIDLVDIFIIFDEVQYTKRDWRNRNKIKSAAGVNWISIPVEVKGKYFQRISETKVVDKKWSFSHWQTIKLAYSKAPHFKLYKDQFEFLYLSEVPKLEYLSEINLTLINSINKILGIKTEVLNDSQLGVIDGKSERLLDLCKKVGATTYVSGPAAKSYLDESIFTNENISVEWMDYSAYPEYPQLYPITQVESIKDEGCTKL